MHYLDILLYVEYYVRSFTIIITAEGTIGKGDSLDVYMKSVNERGAAHDIKLQINKLKKVHILLYIYVCVFSLGYVVRLSTCVHTYT